MYVLVYVAFPTCEDYSVGRGFEDLRNAGHRLLVPPKRPGSSRGGWEPCGESCP